MVASGSEAIRAASKDKVDDLRAALAASRGLLVAFSGGVDSTFLLAVAREVQGDRAVALTAHSASMPRVEREAAQALAARLGVRQLTVESRELEDPRYSRNDTDRCFWCKEALYRLCAEAAAREGLELVVDGFNADDRADHRPGHRAAIAAGVRSPLADAGLTKAEIRAWSERLGLPTWDKPQLACLASRIPYGTPVTPAVLARIEAAEDGVRALGFVVFRVRHHGDLARLELAEGELERALGARERLLEAVRAAGYKLVVLDLEPYRTGRLNELAGVAAGAGER